MLLTAGLMFVWAMPSWSRSQVWLWMVDYEYGVLNWLLTKLHVGNYNHHDWYANPSRGWASITASCRLGRDPVRRGDGLRGPDPGAERARRGGADRRRSGLAGLLRRDRAAAEADLRDPDEPLDHLGLPGVFTQIWFLLTVSRGIDYSTVMSHLRCTRRATCQERVRPRLGDLARDASLILLVVSFVYIREMVRIGESRHEARAGGRQIAVWTRSASACSS